MASESTEMRKQFRRRERITAQTQKTGSSRASIENIDGKICRIQEGGKDTRGIGRVQTSSPRYNGKLTGNILILDQVGALDIPDLFVL